MFDCDWSSDVCSSDLGDGGVDVTEVTYDSRRAGLGTLFVAVRGLTTDGNQFVDAARRKGATAVASENPPRSEERRVGKECRARWRRYHLTTCRQQLKP